MTEELVQVLDLESAGWREEVPGTVAPEPCQEEISMASELVTAKLRLAPSRHVLRRTYPSPLCSASVSLEAVILLLVLLRLLLRLYGRL